MTRAKPMTDLVRAVLSESRAGGRTYNFLQAERLWEGPMRFRFAGLVSDMAVGSPASPTIAEEMFRYLGGKYRTRYPVKSQPDAVRVLVRCIGEQGWWQTAPPDLLECSDGDSKQITDIVPRILDDIQQQGCKRPYSLLLTKYLHFCFPYSFPICDAQAVASIQMWSFLAFEDRGADWERFRSWGMADTSGRGYGAVVEFYRLFWSAAEDAQKVKLARNAQALTDLIGGRVSILDLVDKLLWIAAGDPLPLGLIHSAGA